jgi:hypothetical protein
MDDPPANPPPSSPSTRRLPAPSPTLPTLLPVTATFPVVTAAPSDTSLTTELPVDLSLLPSHLYMPPPSRAAMDTTHQYPPPCPDPHNSLRSTITPQASLPIATATPSLLSPRCSMLPVDRLLPDLSTLTDFLCHPQDSPNTAELPQSTPSPKLPPRFTTLRTPSTLHTQA